MEARCNALIFVGILATIASLHNAEPAADLDPRNPGTTALADLEDAFAFLHEHAWVLQEAGFKVMVPAWWTPDEWLQYVMDSFDCLHAEGALAPTFLGIRLSPQASGRPGALQALDQLLGYIQQREAVWLTSVGELARHCARFVSEADGSSARRQP